MEREMIGEFVLEEMLRVRQLMTEELHEIRHIQSTIQGTLKLLQLMPHEHLYEKYHSQIDKLDLLFHAHCPDVGLTEEVMAPLLIQDATLRVEV